MSDRYWRKIEDVGNDIENAMQISSILLKLKGYDNDLLKIDDNENNISSNLEKIGDNENNISNNLSKIDNISKFLLKSDKDFEKTYNIESQRFEFDKDNNFFTILEEEIEHDFIKNSLLFIKNNMYYKYDDLEDDHHRCQHEYNIYDDNYNLIHKYLFNKDTYYNENSNILNTNEEFCIFLKQNYNKIKIVLELHRHNRHGFGNIDLEIDNNYENYIKIEYIEQGFLDNQHLINLNTESISTNSEKIDKNISSISFNKDLIDINTSSISDNKDLIDINTSSISSNKDLIEKNTSDNLEKINNIENELKTINDIYNETFIISNKTIRSTNEVIFDKTINFDFNTGGFFNILATYNYDKKYNFNHTYYFYNNDNLKLLKKEIISDNMISNVIHEFSFESTDVSSLKILIIYTSDNIQTIKLFGNNSFQFKYREINFKIEKNEENISSNKNLIDVNVSDISDNLGKINTNTSNISSNLEKINELQNSNIKAFYNLDQIFIYDIENGYKNVDKDNYFHIFEKEIYYNFTKNSYLEIALKVLTEISNYVFIGFFQILCNFCDQDNNLFYSISLSTAMGSINKLSTIKSVFIVPINENMSKIKIDFFIAPKDSQQNRAAKFTIQDINSNKIYLKYFQKTDEMSIKDIQNSLNTVNNISNDLEKINKNLSTTHVNILRKVFIYDIYDIELTFKKFKFDNTNKSYLIYSKEIEFDFKAFNYIELYSEILFDYVDDSKIGLLKTEYIIYDDLNKQIEKFDKYQTNSGKNLNNYLITKDYILFINESNNTKLKFDIYVSLIEDFEDNFSYVTLKIINNYKNKLYIKYYENKINR